MFKNTLNTENIVWKGYEKVLFRLAFIYLFLQVFPLDWKYYRHLAALNWLNLSFAEIFQIAKYTPQFVSGGYNSLDWGIATFADWIFILIVAVIGTAVWTFLDKKSKNYAALYAYLRILIRYRLAIAVIAYGFLKLYAVQAAYPSISHLNTLYGDFTTWKIFSLSLGIVPGYQSFLGAVELIAGLLLLFRRTSVIGATIIIFFTGNVFMSNLAYEGGEVVYSFYLVVLALSLVVYDGMRIIKLIVLHVPVAAAQQVLVWNKEWKAIRIVLKSLVILIFVIGYGIGVKRSSANGGYLYASEPGIQGLSGLYNVISFKIDGVLRPASVTDSLRWQDVVFEKSASLSIKINNKQQVWEDNVESVPMHDAARLYEFSGNKGRVYYNYTADTLQHKIILKDLASLAAGSHANSKTNGQLSYKRGPDATLVLTGQLNGRQIEAVLQKSNKKYLLKAAEKGRLRKLTL